MFLHLSVSHSVYRGCVSQHALGQTPPSRPWDTPQEDTPCPVHAGIQTPYPVHAGIHTLPPSQCMLGYMPPTPTGHCCGQYTSYWNAFLLLSLFLYFCNFLPYSIFECSHSSIGQLGGE